MEKDESLCNKPFCSCYSVMDIEGFVLVILVGFSFDGKTLGNVSLKLTQNKVEQFQLFAY